MPTEDELFDQPITPSTLNTVALKAMEARAKELEIQELEERLKLARMQLRAIYREELPNLMDQAQTDRIGIPANGNMPAFDLKLIPYYYANIAAAWPREKRQAAFDALTSLGAQDLIKTEVTVNVPRHDRNIATDLITAITHFGFQPLVRENVHFQTLTAWLKEQYERGNPLPNLNVIGADVGRTVKITERK